MDSRGSKLDAAAPKTHTPDTGGKVVEVLEEARHRTLTGRAAQSLTVIAVAMSLYHIYVLGINPVEPWVFRATHLMFGLVIAFILFRMSGKMRLDKVHWLDTGCAVLAAASCVYVMKESGPMLYRAGVMPTTLDVVFGTICLLAVLDVTRRVSGRALPIIAIIFLLYAGFGEYLPGALGHRGYDFARVVSYTFSLDGIFGTSLGVSATYVFLFVLFGAFLQSSGAGQFFMDMSSAMLGGVRGGPAKMAVASSALFGTISGSSVANVVGTGTFTIPLMKSTGYKADFAAAVEAVASTGGQIMPPIMGAGAFIMADILGVPYLSVCAAAALPALMYFSSVFIMVDLEAVKMGLKGVPRDQLPSAKKVMLSRGHLIIPVIVLLYMLIVLKRTPIMAALWAMACTIPLSWVRPETRMGLKRIIEALEKGARGSVEVIATCACAGIVVGVLTLTGLGTKFAGIIVTLSKGNLALGLFWTMIVSIMLGMGMPTTASYIICASVVAPALVKMGLLPIQAHLFVFYFACVSAITPPVALASYAAAGIAKCNPNKAGWAAVRLGLCAFIAPFMFAYGPSLLWIGKPIEILWAATSAMIGVTALAGGLSGWFMGKAGKVVRIMLVAAALSLIDPGWATDLTGFALILGATAIRFTVLGRAKRLSQGG